jgi:hypothetical protein
MILVASSRCVLCGKALDDPESISRGIGSDCWQSVLQRWEEIKLPVKEMAGTHAMAAAPCGRSANGPRLAVTTASMTDGATVQSPRLSSIGGVVDERP